MSARRVSATRRARLPSARSHGITRCGDFLLHSWESLEFSPPVDIREREERRRRPKRVQREIRDKLREPGVGTKAQQALNLQREQGRLERRAAGPRAARGGKGAPVRAAQAKAKGQAPRALKMPRRRVMPGRLTPAGVQRAGPEEAGARPRVGGGGRLRALRKKRKNFCKNFLTISACYSIMTKPLIREHSSAG